MPKELTLRDYLLGRPKVKGVMGCLSQQMWPEEIVITESSLLLIQITESLIFFNLKRQNCEARVFLLQAALPKNAPTFQKQFSLLHQVMFLVKNEEACFLFIFIF